MWIGDFTLNKGGIIYVFTSFQLGNLFHTARSTVIAIMIGSYNASAVIYAVFYMMYKVWLIDYDS